MHNHPLSARTFLALSLVIEMVVLLSGCGRITRDENTQGDIYLTATTTLNLTTLTSTPALNSHFSIPSATPIVLDSVHWKLHNSPVDLLQSDVQHIGQADNGTMWFGGRKIYRYYDGEWTIFDQKNISVFHGQVILSLKVTDNGVIWLGTEMNEIVSYDGKNWTSQAVGEGGYRENWITSILIRKNGEICAVSIEGLACRKGNSDWIHYSITISDVENRIHVKDAVLTNLDNILVPIDNGMIYYYDGNKWESRKISSWICCMAPSRDGGLWLFSHEGFGKIDTNGNVNYDYTPNIISKYVMTILEANDGSVWIGVGGGHQVVRYVNGTFITVDNKMLDSFVDEKEYSSLDNFPFHQVHTMFQSSDGSIWIGTVGGIFQYR